MSEDFHFRIGELSRRTGASPDLLRVWERRYRLLQPERSSNGYRLYSQDDLTRALEMQAHLARGSAPAEAAELAKVMTAAGRRDPSAVYASDALARLRAALHQYDGGPAADRILDRCLLTLGLAQAIQLVLLPFLRDLGRRWQSGEITVAQEHFASNVIRRRLVSLAEGWEADGERVALLASAPGEQHDIGLVCFGLALHAYHGWRVTYLGADTPLAGLLDATRAIGPDLVAVNAVTPARFFSGLTRWRALCSEAPVGIGGAGAGARIAQRIGAGFLSGDPVTAAARAASA